jgi:hypothetical protein
MSSPELPIVRLKTPLYEYTRTKGVPLYAYLFPGSGRAVTPSSYKTQGGHPPKTTTSTQHPPKGSRAPSPPHHERSSMSEARKGGPGHRLAIATSVQSGYIFDDKRLRRPHPTKKGFFTKTRHHSCIKCTALHRRKPRAGHAVVHVVEAGSAATTSVFIHHQTCPHTTKDEKEAAARELAKLASEEATRLARSAGVKAAASRATLSVAATGELGGIHRFMTKTVSSGMRIA